MEHTPQSIGRFQILRRFDGGGAGELFLAHDPRSNRAITVRSIAGLEPRALNLLRDQLPRLVTLTHRAVVPVLEFGLHEDSAWIASNHAGVDTLADLITRRKDVSLRQKLTLVCDLCEGLGAALAQGITVLDVSPSGIWLTDSGGMFRIGGLVLPPDPALLARGKSSARDAAYLSPEQIHGANQEEEASFVFRIGILLYELLAYQRPFAGPGPLETIHNILVSHPPPLPAVGEAATQLEIVVRRALAKIAADRYHSLEALADELRSLVRVIEPDGGEMTAGAAAAAGPVSLQEPEREEVLHSDDDPASLVYDENVQFTVFQPKSLTPGVWQTMLVFAHLSEAREDAPPDEPDPIEEMQRQAQAVLGDLKASGRQTVDSPQAVPREGELTFVPRADGVEFNPPSRQFKWTESVHREEFRLRAAANRAVSVARGRLSVFLGSILLAEIPLALKVGPAQTPASDDIVRQAARPYRRIFASYSHLDKAIVDEFADYAKAMGDRYQLDVIDLRSGDPWAPALQSLIRHADVFQLFWSWNSLRSAYVRDEWQYALGLRRDSFVRPVYWEEPIPKEGDLPPAALLDLHFEPIRPRSLPKSGVRRSVASKRRRPASDPPSVGAPRAADSAGADVFSVPAPIPSPAEPARPAPAVPPPASKPTPAPSVTQFPSTARPARETPLATSPAVIAPSTHPSERSASAPSRRRIPWRVVGPAIAALLLVTLVPTYMLTRSGDITPPSIAPGHVFDNVIVQVTGTNGQLVSGAAVRLEDGPDSFDGVTDASGRATFTLPRFATPRDYRVTVDVPGMTRIHTRRSIDPEVPVVKIELPNSR